MSRPGRRFPDRMPVLVDDDLRFDDGGGPRPAVAVNRWLRELPSSGAPSAGTWAVYARVLRDWMEFCAGHGTGGRVTLKWPHSSPLIWPHLGAGGGVSSHSDLAPPWGWFPATRRAGSGTCGAAGRIVVTFSCFPLTEGGWDGTRWGCSRRIREDHRQGIRGPGARAEARGAPADGAGGADVAGARSAEDAGAGLAGAGLGGGADRRDARGRTWRRRASSGIPRGGSGAAAG